MQRERWIDWMRGLAIVAVLADHLFYIYTEVRIDMLWQQLYFSIPWFVFLSGVSSYISFARKNFTLTFMGIVSYWKKRFLVLFLPYFLASTAIFFFLNNFVFVPSEFFRQLLFFSVQPTYYFVNLILQLSFIAPFLYICLRRFNRWGRIVLIFGIIFLSFVILSTRYPPWPFSPAGRAFGGLYLVVFFSGMVLSYVNFRLKAYQVLLIGLLFAWYEIFLLAGKINFFSRVPSLSFIIWSLAFAVLAVFTLRSIRLFKSIEIVLYVLGRHSYFIYLFHFMILLYLSPLSFFHTKFGGVTAVFISVIFSLFFDYLYNSLIYLIRILWKR